MTLFLCGASRATAQEAGPGVPNAPVELVRVVADGLGPEWYAGILARSPEGCTMVVLDTLVVGDVQAPARGTPEGALPVGVPSRSIVEVEWRADTGDAWMPLDHHAFNNAALAVARSCRFRPGQIDGQPVRAVVRMPVNFTLRR